MLSGGLGKALGFAVSGFDMLGGVFKGLTAFGGQFLGILGDLAVGLFNVGSGTRLPAVSTPQKLSCSLRYNNLNQYY